MLPANDILEQARRARDSRFDGRFFIGVRTTGVYCRPVCPVKMPRQENVTFFPSAAAASEAGYRPCLRCRPEASPGTPAWKGSSATVSRGLKLIDAGALNEGSMTDLSDRLGVTPRHLNRLFKKYLGASAKAIGQTRRLQFAKRLIDETELTMTEVAMSAGYGSIRRFNDHFKRTYGRAPASLRNGSPSLASTKEAAPAREAVTLRLAYRAPFDFAGLLRFYSMRAIPGVEQVTADAYSRAWDLGGSDTERRLGWVKISDDPASSSLVLQVCGVPPSDLMQLVSRVRQVFDLDALPAEINCVLNADKGFAQLAKSNPGQRLPGGWDPFETAVRAIVGQQISVKAATTVMGKIAAYWGESTGAMRSFPGPERLAEMSTASLPMPTARAETIRRLAQAVRDGKLVLAPAQEAEALVATLTAIKGIGPWTAQYIAMRALGDPDTFLHGDLVIKKTAARHLGLTSERALLARAEAWRPWRAYAGMHLWRLAGQHSD